MGPELVATKEASNRSIDGMIASASNSDLREMRAKRDFSGIRTARSLRKGANSNTLKGTFLCKETLTDIMKTSIAVCSKFTTSRGLTISIRTQELWLLGTMTRCKQESTESCETHKNESFFDLIKLIYFP